MTPETRKTLANGLWHNNPALVQILGLCPLLATSTDTINALGLGMATIFVLTLSNTLVAATRRWLRPEIRIPVFVLLIAGAVTVVEILIQALAYPLYQSLGIYLALIVTTVLWPPAAWLRRRGVPPGLASLLVILSSFGSICFVIWVIAPSVGRQSQTLYFQAFEGIQRAQLWLQGPP